MAQEFKLNYTGLEINNKLQKINCSDTVNNTFANALKGSKTGEAIALTDISPVEHNLKVKVRGENTEAVKLFAQGKNVIGKPKSLAKLSYENGVYTQTEADTRTSLVSFDLCRVNQNHSYIDTLIYVRLRESDGTLKTGLHTATFTVPNDNYNRLRFGISGQTINNFSYHNYIPRGEYTLSFELLSTEQGAISWKNLQIELNSTATEYEPYKEPIEYTQAQDIISIYPCTTLTTDTTGALIECEYNRDINKAFIELQQAIISLGGNV